MLPEDCIIFGRHCKGRLRVERACGIHDAQNGHRHDCTTKILLNCMQWREPALLTTLSAVRQEDQYLPGIEGILHERAGVRKGGGLDWASSMLSEEPECAKMKAWTGRPRCYHARLCSHGFVERARMRKDGNLDWASSMLSRLIVFPWLRGPTQGQHQSHVVCSKQAPSRSTCHSLPRVLSRRTDEGLPAVLSYSSNNGMFFGSIEHSSTSLTENTNFLPCK